MRVTFDKIDGFIRVCGGEFRHLVLFDYGLFEKICDKIKYLISKTSSITDSINHNFKKIRIDSYDFLPVEKILIFHNVIILSQLFIRIKITVTGLKPTTNLNG